MSGRLLIYGATGYSGRLIAEHAAATGLDVIVGGCEPGIVAALAENLGVEGWAFGVDDRDKMLDHLSNVDCVLSAAGPFRNTARQVINACIETGVHYLDVCMEFTVFAFAASRANDAANAGVMLMCGGSWGVVVPDCLALHTAHRVTDAERLTIALRVTGSHTRGSLDSVNDVPELGPLVRRRGALITLEEAEPRQLDFGYGPEECIPAALASLVSAHQATGIENIDVFLDTAAGCVTIDSPPAIPSREELVQGRYQALAEVTDASGRAVRSLIDTPNAYAFSQLCSVEIARRILAGEFTAGYQSPASVYGSSFVTAIGDTKIVDL
ncbi:saccharopine dehydrogenase NADP-binding domain-containing protein [Actinosynnema sp. NPDC023587]|uniref:saccharopine dehydrogenase NADP-binding domain-containing protein n=1 Tax=Actinosynnema sp. NPDC023587 TaxID=3154695 RepID=UPI0033D0D665